MTDAAVTRWGVLGLLAFGAGCSSQGFAQQTFTDVFQQAAEGQVDILFVVDNSQSMEDEQYNVAASFVDFIYHVEESNTDWHLGVVTTDMNDPEQRGRLITGDDPDLSHVKVLTSEVPDYPQVFADMVQVGIVGSKLERGLDAAMTALTPPLVTHDNEGFLREEAQLAIIIISDENDCSDGGAIAGVDSDDCSEYSDLLRAPSEFVSSFRALKEDASDVVFSAIVGTEADEDSAGCPNAYAGRRYMQVAETMGGLVLPICTDPAEFGQLMDTLGLSVSGQRDRFELSRVPAEDSIEVVVVDENGNEDTVSTKDAEGNGWTYDAATNYVIFWGSALPPRGSTVKVTYRLSSGPTSTTT